MQLPKVQLFGTDAEVCVHVSTYVQLLCVLFFFFKAKTSLLEIREIDFE